MRKYILPFIIGIFVAFQAGAVDIPKGTFYFDKAEVVALLQDAIDDIKTTLKSLQDGN